MMGDVGGYFLDILGGYTGRKLHDYRSGMRIRMGGFPLTYRKCTAM